MSAGGRDRACEGQSAMLMRQPETAELPRRQRRTRDLSAMGQTVSRPLLDIRGHARPDATTQCVTCTRCSTKIRALDLWHCGCASRRP